MEQLGRGHAALRRIRALRRDAASRRLEGVFLAEGLHLADEALRHGAAIEEVVVSPRLSERAEGRALLDRILARKLLCRETSDAILNSVQDARSAQPILLVVRMPRWTLEQVVACAARPALLTVVCSLQDPGNLGTIIRSTDAAHGSGCCSCGPGADLFHPRTVRASMGSIFRLPIVRAEPEELLARFRSSGIVALGADPRRGKAHVQADLRRPTALLFGGEAGGLPEPFETSLDERVRIPMREGVDSLSVGAAAAVLLFEAARQRTPGSRPGVSRPGDG